MTSQQNKGQWDDVGESAGIAATLVWRSKAPSAVEVRTMVD